MPAWASAVAPPAHREWPAMSEGKWWCSQWMNQLCIGIVPSSQSQSCGWKGKRRLWDFKYLQKGSSGLSPEELHWKMILFPSKKWSALWPGRKKAKPLGKSSTKPWVDTFWKFCKAFLSGQTNSPRCMRAWKLTSKMTKNRRLSWLLEDMYSSWSSASSGWVRGCLCVVGMDWSFLQPHRVLVTRWWWWFLWTLE